jgi:hypothetical protein
MRAWRVQAELSIIALGERALAGELRVRLRHASVSFE